MSLKSQERGQSELKERKYEITSDGQIKVNLNSLVRSGKVKEFYRSITPKETTFVKRK
jgi:hypothetical protein